METQRYDLRKYIIRAGLLLLAIIVLYVCYDNLVFRLKSTTPSLDAVADSSTEIRYHFSQPVKSIKLVSVNDIPVEPSIKERDVVIPLNKTLESGSKYSVVMKGIQSEWFGLNIRTIERSFIPKYIDFNRLSDEERRNQVNKSNSGQVDDLFISRSAFPIFNERWQIDATVDTSSRTAILNIKFFEEIPDYDHGGVVTRVSNETAEKYRREVLEKIKENGGNPEKYTIIYDNPYLYEKYTDTDTH